MSDSSSKHFMVGYGSLLSADSRKRFSNITSDAIPLTLNGWIRAWHTRSFDEYQTYVGAHRDGGASLNGVLLEIDEISPSLQKREQDYQFVQVSVEEIDFHVEEDVNHQLTVEIDRHTIWVCQTLDTLPAERDYPIYQSYIDTCLLGCLETEIDGFVQRFIESTDLWHHHWLNDRADPQYPRAAKVTKDQINAIDKILDAMQVLPHRIEMK